MNARRARDVFHLAILAMIGLALAAAMTLRPVSAGEGLPPSPPREYPSVCEVAYTLQPGERLVLFCEAPVPRGGLQGIAQISSGNEAVDATLVQRFPRGAFVFAVTNRSAEAVTATARGEQW